MLPLVHVNPVEPSTYCPPFPILTLEGISKSYSAAQGPAVNQIGFVLAQGEILGLLGPSGCGKTTLLRIIAGFERPQSGQVQLAGQFVCGPGQWLPPEQRAIGMVFQDFALFPHLSVGDNVAFGLRPEGKRQARFRRQSGVKTTRRIREVLELVGLQGMERRYPHELSGGQQQRVALARALAPQPRLVLLDEPLSNLDVQVRLRLRQDLRDILKTAGISAIFVTHDQEEAMVIADRVAVMRAGNLEQIDTPEEIYQRPSSQFVAEFVTQANFIQAHWQGQYWQTEVGQFGLEPALTDLHQPHTQGVIMIRQEDVQLHPDHAAATVIRDRQFLGREYRYCLETASGQELHARMPTHTALDIGTTVQVVVDHHQIQIFPAVPPIVAA